MLIEAIIGFLAFLAGVIAISRPTKNLHPAIKYTPIFLCAIGAFCIWNYFSQIIPAVADAKVTVLDVQSHRMYIGVDPHFARKCQVRGIDVYLVDSDKVETRVPANFVDPKDYSLPRASLSWQSDSILEIQANPRKYESFYFVEYDRCAFDIHVRSEFGRTLVPQKFNAGVPVGDVPTA